MQKVDARGEQCPIPVVRAKKILDQMTAGETLEVLVDNEIAVKNVEKLAKSLKASSSIEKLTEKEYRILITASERNGDSGQKAGNTVVVLSSDLMGIGEEQLGKTLIKGFLFALTQLEQRPQTVLLYNGGARLSSENHETAEDLRNLEAAGTEILTCGTCLDYYGLTEKLQVGTITNMYVIAEKLSAADKVIRP